MPKDVALVGRSHKLDDLVKAAEIHWLWEAQNGSMWVALEDFASYVQQNIVQNISQRLFFLPQSAFYIWKLPETTIALRNSKFFDPSQFRLATHNQSKHAVITLQTNMFKLI